MFSVLLTENIFRFEDNFSCTLRWSVFGALEARTGNKLKSGAQRRQMIITFKSPITVNIKQSSTFFRQKVLSIYEEERE